MDTQHIICNAEIGATYCGLGLPYMEVSDPTPWGVLGRSGDVAIWDNDTFLETHVNCGACLAAYDA